MRLIDADALVEAIKDYPYGFRGMIVCDIAKQPTIEPKKARWHKRNNVNFSPFDGLSEYEFTCGWCGGATDRMTNYCPNCGAMMSGDIKDSE